MSQQSDLVLDDPAAPIYTIGQVAAALSIGQAALRRFDGFGIVSPGRSDGGQRRYSRADVEQLREVLSLMDEGLSLVGVAKVFELRQRVAHLEDRLAQYEDSGE